MHKMHRIPSKGICFPREVFYLSHLKRKRMWLNTTNFARTTLLDRIIVAVLERLHILRIAAIPRRLDM